MSRSMIILWKTVRIVVFTAAAVLIFVFPGYFTEYAAFVVGSVMILFALDDLIRIKVVHGSFRLLPTGVNDLVSVFLGVLMMVFLHSTATNSEHLIKVCTIWAVWSIIEEGYELYEFCSLFREKKMGILGGLCSLSVIVLSVLLIIDPEAHIRFHIIILGVELILKYAFSLLYELAYHAKQRKQVGSEPQIR